MSECGKPNPQPGWRKNKPCVRDSGHTPPCNDLVGTDIGGWNEAPPQKKATRGAKK